MAQEWGQAVILVHVGVVAMLIPTDPMRQATWQEQQRVSLAEQNVGTTRLVAEKA